MLRVYLRVTIADDEMTKAMKAEYVGAESRGFSPRPLLGTGRKIDFSVSGDFEPIPIQVVMRLRFCASDSDQKRLKAGKKQARNKESQSLLLMLQLSVFLSRLFVHY